MTWKFLHLENEWAYNYFDIAFSWYLATPKLLKEIWKMEDDRAQFVEDLSKGMNFAGFLNGKFVAMIHGEPKSEEIIEGHLFCQRKVNIDFLVALVMFSKNIALTKYNRVITATSTKHKTMLEITKRAGFLDTGVRSWDAIHKGQLLEVQYNIAL